MLASLEQMFGLQLASALLCCSNLLALLLLYLGLFALVSCSGQLGVKPSVAQLQLPLKGFPPLRTPQLPSWMPSWRPSWMPLSALYWPPGSLCPGVSLECLGEDTVWWKPLSLHIHCVLSLIILATEALHVHAAILTLGWHCSDLAGSNVVFQPVNYLHAE